MPFTRSGEYRNSETGEHSGQGRSKDGADLQYGAVCRLPRSAAILCWVHGVSDSPSYC